MLGGSRCRSIEKNIFLSLANLGVKVCVLGKEGVRGGGGEVKDPESVHLINL